MRLAWTGGYVSVDMFADNKKISAYSMSVEGNVMEGWIALEPNQKIHLAYNMQSNHSEYKLDMMLDGIIRNTVSHYRNGKKKDRKTEKAIRGKVESASVYVEGKQDQQEMVIDSLNLVSSSQFGTPTAGTIEVRFYSCTSGGEKEFHDVAVPFYDEVDRWEDLGVQASDNGATVDRHIVFKPLTRVLKNSHARYDDCRKSSLKRPGAAPWIILRFHYRCQETLKNASLLGEKSKAGKQSLQVAASFSAQTIPSGDAQDEEQSHLEEFDNSNLTSSAKAEDEVQTDAIGKERVEADGDDGLEAEIEAALAKESEDEVESDEDEVEPAVASTKMADSEKLVHAKLSEYQARLLRQQHGWKELHSQDKVQDEEPPRRLIVANAQKRKHEQIEAVSDYEPDEDEDQNETAVIPANHRDAPKPSHAKTGRTRNDGKLCRYRKAPSSTPVRRVERIKTYPATFSAYAEQLIDGQVKRKEEDERIERALYGGLHKKRKTE
ncbi:MAG: hypothetical protein MMC33_007168 [Icmadophila ericetorum]|nr:hypothetical protein [Icmadophila ericetorum]